MPMSKPGWCQALHMPNHSIRRALCMLIVSLLFIRQRLDRIPVFRNEGLEEKAMSSKSYNTFNGPAQSPSLPHRGSALRGFLVGFIPLGLLLLIGPVTVLLTALVRQLVASSGFVALQQASVIVLIAGLVVALVV